MRKFRSLRSKIVTSASIGIVVIGGILITNSAITMRNSNTMHAETLATEAAAKHALVVSTALNGGYDASLFIAGILSNSAPLYSPSPMDRLRANMMLSSILEANSNFKGVYTVWEPDAFDGIDFLLENTAGHDATGRFIPYWSLDANGNPSAEPRINYEGQGVGDYYLIPKNTMQPAVIGPYMHSIQGLETSIISIVSPIIIDGIFVGIAGIDVRADFLQDMVDSTYLYDGKAVMSILNGENIFVAVTNSPELIGQHAHGENDLHQEIDSDETSSLFYEDGFLECIVPLRLEDVEFDWSISVRIPESKILAAGRAAMWKQVFIGVVLIALLLNVLYYSALRLSKPLGLLSDKALAIAKGDLTEKVVITANDEIGLLSNSIAEVVSSSLNLTTIVEAVADGDYSLEATVRSDKDKLSISLNSMIGSLRESKEDSATKISYLNKIPTPYLLLTPNSIFFFLTKQLLL